MKKLILRVTAIMFIGGLTGVFSQESGGSSSGGSGCDCGGAPPPPPGGAGQPSSSRPRPTARPDASACGAGTRWDPSVMKCVGAAPQSTTITP